MTTPPPFEIGGSLPPWHLQSVSGEPLAPEATAFRGRPLLILFFSFGCPGCVHRAIPYANRVIVERGGEVQVVGIHTHIEGAETSDGEIRRQMDALYVRFPVYRDTGLAATYHDYRAGGTPHWILVDASGVVVDSIFGSDPNRALLRLDYHLMEVTETAVVGFGGGCHWCTEAVFQSLRGVDRVEQGWIRSEPPHDSESEAVLVHFRPEEIGLETLIEIHLLTHASTSEHSMRGKYRSAIYTLSAEQRDAASGAMETLSEASGAAYVTQILPFEGFKLNQEDLLRYYQTRPDAPFCQTYIHPKLKKLRALHAEHMKPEPAASGDSAIAPEAADCAIPEIGAGGPGASGVLTWREVIRFTNHGNPTPPHRAEKTDAEWRALLSPEAFRITREHGTEAAHSSDLCGLFEPGRYACACCATPLFDTAEKIGSTGWPTFTQPLAPNVVAYRRDARGGTVRVEAVCNVCDAHLGHVSPDGPAPSGLRYCINGVALQPET